jgi:hypothetical protein
MRTPIGTGWVEHLTPDDLTGADQKKYLKAIRDMRRAQRDAMPPPEIDPENPAYMPDPRDQPLPELSDENDEILLAKVYANVIKAWSFEYQLPYTAEAGEKLPLPAVNALRVALRPVISALNGIVPKESTSSTSAST